MLRAVAEIASGLWWNLIQSASALQGEDAHPDAAAGAGVVKADVDVAQRS